MTTEEQTLLREVQSHANDYLYALENDGFADFCGGVDKCLDELKSVNEEWELRFNTLDDIE